MSRCEICHRDGLLFVKGLDLDGYVVLACTCPLGAQWRVPWQLRAYVNRLEPAPLWYGRLEEFFSAKEIATLQPKEKINPVRDGREQVS
jgi:hypothetical protein